MNVLGAGDAFMAGLLKGWLTGASWREAARMANACGALWWRDTPAPLRCLRRTSSSTSWHAQVSIARTRTRISPGSIASAAGKNWDDLAVLAFDTAPSSRTSPGRPALRRSASPI